MTRKITLAENPADDITAGRPERYYDYVYETYGKAFRSGSVEGLETFRELYRQVFMLGNERSTISSSRDSFRCFLCKPDAKY